MSENPFDALTRPRSQPNNPPAVVADDRRALLHILGRMQDEIDDLSVAVETLTDALAERDQSIAELKADVKRLRSGG